MQVHNRPDFVPFLKKQFPDKGLILYLHNVLPYAGEAFADAAGVVDHFVFVSHFLAEEYARLYPDCSTRTTVIHNSVDTHRFRPSVRETKVVESLRHRHGLPHGR